MPHPPQRSFACRLERFVPRPDAAIEMCASLVADKQPPRPLHGRLLNLSFSGFAVVAAEAPAPGTLLVDVRLGHGDVGVDCGPCVVSRTAPHAAALGGLDYFTIGVAFSAPLAELPPALVGALTPQPYVTDELRDDVAADPSSEQPESPRSFQDFYHSASNDLFDKCHAFRRHVRGLQERQLYQALYRVTLTSGLDHRVTIFNPIRRVEHEMICYDSNSYLHLHRHPRVIEAVKQAIDAVGYGTASAQLFCGTSKYLRELEETLSAFHGRDDTIVFSSGYAANIGTLTALVRRRDAVVRDEFSHASIHDGCRWSGSRFARTYPHLDTVALDQVLAEANDNASCMGKLVVTDGIFSMHGHLAPLPEISAVARRHGAKLMVDEAHSTGIIGATGRGIEEHFGLSGAADVLMGTFSKAPGTAGGYVCGSRELITYLRFYAHSAMFTAALPAPICAGVTAAYRVMQTEPQHREALWRNVHALAAGLVQAGFHVSKAESAILTVFIGSEKLLWLISRQLFDCEIKAGNVRFPAVPRGEAILRFSVNARHTPDDIDRTVDALRRLGERHGILSRSKAEIREIGERVADEAGGAAL